MTPNFGYIGGLTAAWTAMHGRNDIQPMTRRQAIIAVYVFSFLLGASIGGFISLFIW
jgi:hypothetical protein